jgi:DNA-binding protein YbaB
MEELTGFDKVLAEMRAEASAGSRLVHAVVDGSGRLVALSVRPELLRLAPEAAANMVLATVNKAQDNARDQVEKQFAVAAEDRDTLLGRIEADIAEGHDRFERRMDEVRMFASDFTRGRDGVS